MLSGKVTDDKGTPLVGVTISAVGQPKNALTDNSGSFSIQVTEKVRTLRMSYVGYNSKDVNVNGKSSVSVVLSQVFGWPFLDHHDFGCTPCSCHNLLLLRHCNAFFPLKLCSFVSSQSIFLLQITLDLTLYHLP